MQIVEFKYDADTKALKANVGKNLCLAPLDPESGDAVGLADCDKAKV